MTWLLKHAWRWIWSPNELREWFVELTYLDGHGGKTSRWISDRLLAVNAHEALSQAMADCGVTPTWVVSARTWRGGRA